MGAEGRYVLVRDVFEGEFAALEFVHDADDVRAGFAIGRYAVIAIDGGWAGVVSGQRDGETAGVVERIVAVQQLVEVGGAAGDVLCRASAA
jgi:hypothetical protein